MRTLLLMGLLLMPLLVKTLLLMSGLLRTMALVSVALVRVVGRWRNCGCTRLYPTSVSSMRRYRCTATSRWGDFRR